MSPRTRRQLRLWLLAWLAAVFLVVRAMGPAEPPPAHSAPAPAPAPASPPEPVAPPPEPAPAPEPIAERDELIDFVPCPASQRPGAAVISEVATRYDNQGRFVLRISYAGILGGATIRESLPPPKSVTALDLAGQYKIGPHRYAAPADGPVSGVFLGQHRGFTRLSVNYENLLAPWATRREILCRTDGEGGELALRLAFEPGPRKAAPDREPGPSGP